jgi:hypothetical protein
MCVVHLKDGGMLGNMPDIVSTLGAMESERRPTSIFPFSVNERLSGKGKNNQDHFFPRGSRVLQKCKGGTAKT